MCWGGLKASWSRSAKLNQRVSSLEICHSWLKKRMGRGCRHVRRLLSPCDVWEAKQPIDWRCIFHTGSESPAVVYWIYSAAVSALPDPVPHGDGPAYLWLYRFSHTIAGNLTTAFGSRIPGLKILGLVAVVPLLLGLGCVVFGALHDSSRCAKRDGLGSV